MFEIVEVGSRLTKSDYEAQLPALRTRMLQLQEQLLAAGIPLTIIIAGVEGAGKGALVSRLNEWLDARHIQTHAFWEESDEERERPYFWRFWRKLPARGKTAIFFGSWYTQPIVDRVLRRSNDAELALHTGRINEIERMLCADGALIVKFWMHLTAEQQQQALQEDLANGLRPGEQCKRYAKHYREFRRVSAEVIRCTDSGCSPWRLVEAADRRHREIAVARLLVAAIEQRLQFAGAKPTTTAASPPVTAGSGGRNVLDQVDLSQHLDADRYKKKLAKFQARLNDLSWQAHAKKRSIVVVFEGWDAAGKGSTIRRITAAIDARLYRVIPVAAPSDEERDQHYLWRFWRHLPRAGYTTLYDRSWYGRVLVERVEAYARDEEWLRAYQEINDFESQLREQGVIVCKFWLHIDADEQLRRFHERENTPWKRHKIGPEDYRNRAQWPAYQQAVQDMVAHTSTGGAPWELIPANCKKFARVAVLKTLCHHIAAALAENT